jgi:hypothetical protein
VTSTGLSNSTAASRGGLGHRSVQIPSKTLTFSLLEAPARPGLFFNPAAYSWRTPPSRPREVSCYWISRHRAPCLAARDVSFGDQSRCGS